MSTLLCMDYGHSYDPEYLTSRLGSGMVERKENIFNSPTVSGRS